MLMKTSTLQYSTMQSDMYFLQKWQIMRWGNKVQKQNIPRQNFSTLMSQK